MAKRHDIEKVIQIGDELFRRKGYHDTGTDEILKAADFPRSSFYHHFGNKEGFGIRTMEYYGQRVLKYMKSILEDPEKGSPVSRLRQYYFSMIALNVETSFATSCLVQRFSMDVSGVAGPLQEASAKEFETWLEVVTSCVREGQEEEEIRKDMPAEDIAKMFFTTIYGGLALVRLSRKPDGFDEIMENIFQLIGA